MSGMNVATRGQDVADKAYVIEQRLSALWNHLGPIAAGGGNGQRQTVFSTADQVISSNTDIAVTSLGYTVVAGAYLISGKLIATQGTGAVTQALGFTGPATSHVRISAEWFSSPGGGAYATGANVLGTLAGGVTTPAFSAGVQNYWDFEGMVVFTAGGTLQVVAHANGANTFTMGSYSFLTAETVGQTT